MTTLKKLYLTGDLLQMGIVKLRLIVLSDKILGPVFLLYNVTLFQTISKSGTVCFGFVLLPPKAHMYGINLPMSLTCEICLKSEETGCWPHSMEMVVNPSNW